MTREFSNYMKRFCNLNLDIKSIRQKDRQTKTESDRQTKTKTDRQTKTKTDQEGYIEELTRFSQCLNAKTGFVNF